MNKERLEEAKKLIDDYRNCYHDGESLEIARTFVKKHAFHLIEQAERVQELEELKSHHMKQIQFLTHSWDKSKEENKRMREAIESARDEQEVHQRLGGSIDNDVVRILDEAIKPWRVKHNE